MTIFDADNELDGVELGSYSDLDELKMLIAQNVENGKFGSKCPVFQLHKDSDGVWTPQDAKTLVKELRQIKKKFKKSPPIDIGEGWQASVAKEFNISVNNLNDCFFDVDGEPLLDRLIGLAKLSQKSNLPILFQ